MKYILLPLLILIPIQSCSSFKEMGQNQVEEGHYKLYTYPEHPKKYLDLIKYEEREESLKENNKDDRYEDFILVSINDFKGRIKPEKVNFLDRAQNSSYEIKKGGISGLKSYFKILRKRFKDQVHIVSSGSMFSKDKSPEEIIFYLNYLDIDVAGIGKADFQIPYSRNVLDVLDAKTKKADFDIILSNAFDLTKNDKKEFEYIKNYTIKKSGKLNIGYISLMAPSLINNIDSQKLTGVYFEKLPVKIIKLSSLLRKQGADIIVTMISEGIDCTSQQSQELNIDEYKVNFLEEDSKVCNNFENETISTLRQLPPSYVDVILANGKDSKVANYINGYPVVQNYDNGTDFSWIKLTFDTKHQRVVKSKTKILQPVSTCHQFFKETQDCYTKEVLRNVEIKKARFLKEKIKIEGIPTHK